ncbi:STY0301 family protein [Rhodanobacter sp. B04]|uniref:STY0301 family protein n=1 Tax=Rhodanobacter sp. B04 TaxID=1945860 RepID=UPI0011159144|nr:STY0301 family protein [Rhodanobacter sp. B04]
MASLRAITLLCLSIVWASQLFAENVSCPESISVAEALHQPPPEGWAMQSYAPVRYLAGVTFFDGDPKENQSIAPARDIATKGRERIAQWRLGSGAEPVWLACRYLDTGISLVRRLPASYIRNVS